MCGISKGTSRRQAGIEVHGRLELSTKRRHRDAAYLSRVDPAAIGVTDLQKRHAVSGSDNAIGAGVMIAVDMAVVCADIHDQHPCGVAVSS